MTSRLENRAPHKLNVLIVEDHPLFREGLEKALGLEDDIRVVGFATDGEEGLRLTRKLLPDVVVLDVNLPGMNGIQVARQLKSEQSQVGIIMLTAYHDSTQVLYAMRAGASAYCAKDIAPDELVSIIRDVADDMYIVDGQRFDHDGIENWIQGNIEEIIGPNTLDPEQHYIPLSPRETEILNAVTNGMSNKEIAVSLGISQQTVKNHMTSILRKLNVEDRTQAAVTALRHGWVRIQDNKDEV